MKKIIILFLAQIISSNSIFAVEKSTSDLKDFYFKKGYAAAKEKERSIGYEIALKDFKAILSKYKDDIVAANAGKIMIQKGKISYPRIYKEKVNGSYRIKIMPSKVEEDFSVDDLFILPLLNKKQANLALYTDSEETNSITSSSSDVASSDVATLPEVEPPSIPKNNSFSLPDLNQINQRRRVRHLSSKKKTNVIFIKGRSHKTEEAINAFGINAQITKDGYNIIFSGKRDKEKFCDYLVGDKTCSSLR